jgi:hypothetical protein
MNVSNAPDKMLQNLASNSSNFNIGSQKKGIAPLWTKVYLAGSTLTVKVPMPATRPTKVSPATTAATPSGVPV